MATHLAPEIATFVRVIDLGSFASVADERGLTSSGISRTVSRLEASLGFKLLHRSTRRLTLTPEGEVFLRHARNILAMLEAARSDISKETEFARGHLKINSGSAFAHHKLAPILPTFNEVYPDITVEVSIDDRRVDPFAEHSDITIRVGALTDSDLVAVRLGTVSRVIAASPAYLKKHGQPTSAADLLSHNCLLLRGFPHQSVWPFRENGELIDIEVAGTFTSDSAEMLLQAAIAGLGIVRLGDFLGEEALKSGKLFPILRASHIENAQAITALMPPGRQSLPRVRAMLDFLKAKT
ncbi:LysR family transcriptional regulator [Roseibium porphyridii]|uniref:LysR family transcriptional regulator n=1 Tax=Roseibium porphyridii TaxID=2866279 RepID=A0ABY8F2W9_9HYPH|nr:MULTISPECIES: LysR family transcriptional regulator [Stappiaceae]QFT34619.1 HTH-type transcriptional regulator DmlR [Labrenzia sp. THAF82]WFE89586.1 LysR family transcriptional regulator [Roseibium sp. KMA01]